MISEQLAVVAALDPDSYSADTYYTDAVDMKYWERVMFILNVGDMASTATVDFGVVEGSTTSPTTAITGKSITQLTQAGTGNDKQAVIEVRAEEMDPDNRYVRGKVTVGVGACDVSVVAIAEGWHKPASDFDLASVDEIVA
jgi:hypothetical protein